MTTSHPTFSDCPWCGTRNKWGALECRRCGGPQPAVETADAGPAPPPPPRGVPAGYGRRLFLTQVVGLVGAIFAVIGLPFAVVFPIISFATGDWLFLLIGGSLGGLFTLLGLGMFVVGLRQVQRRIDTYRNGHAARGTVVEVLLDRSIAINGRSPWRVTYTYNVMGISHSGSAHTWHPIVEPGSPVHVLYMPNEPGNNAVYPPLGIRKP